MSLASKATRYTIFTIMVQHNHNRVKNGNVRENYVAPTPEKKEKKRKVLGII